MRPIPGWSTLKEFMRSRFVPSSYTRDLYNRLARLVQGGRSVEEYHKEMEMIMARANIEEDDDRKMARFLGGLNMSISEELELYEYHTMEELVQKAMKIERRMKARSLVLTFDFCTPKSFEDDKELRIRNRSNSLFGPLFPLFQKYFPNIFSPF